MKPADLSGPEQLPWEAFSGGEWADLGSGAARPPVIRAEVIAALLLGAAQAAPGGTAGIRLRGAAVTGRLDVAAGRAAWPLVCDGCQFGTGIGFVDSTLRTVRILNSELPALDGTGLRLNGTLDMTGSQVGARSGCSRPGWAGSCGCAGSARGQLVPGLRPSWREGCLLTGRQIALAWRRTAWFPSRAPR